MADDERNPLEPHDPTSDIIGDTSVYSIAVIHNLGFLAIKDSIHKKWIKMDFDDWEDHAVELFSLAKEGADPWNFEKGFDSLNQLFDHLLKVYNKRL